jgi:hypothetical protein
LLRTEWGIWLNPQIQNPILNLQGGVPLGKAHPRVRDGAWRFRGLGDRSEKRGVCSEGGNS